MTRLAVAASLTLCLLVLGSAGTAAAQVPAHKLPTDRSSLPPFKGITLNGDSVRASEYEGRVILLNFWAMWCGPCIQELPHIETLHERYSDDEDVQVKTVYLKNEMGRRSMAEVRSWMDDRAFTVPVVYDRDGSIQRAFGFRGVPLNLIIGRDGSILAAVDHTPLETFERRVTRRIDEVLDTEEKSSQEEE